MTSLLKELEAALASKKESDTIIILKRILSDGRNIELSSKDTVVSLLKSEGTSLKKLSAEVIAEWAKEKSNRLVFTDVTIVNILLKWMTDKNDEVVIHSARALGNISFENQEAVNLIDPSCLDNIIVLLKSDNSKIILNVTGMLVNILNYNEVLAKRCLKNNILSVIEDLFVKYGGLLTFNEPLISFLLNLVNKLADYCDDMGITFPESLCKCIIDVFKASTKPELSVTCLEAFHGLSEKDEVLSLLAQEGVCELLIDLIEKYKYEVKDDDTRSVLKMACDLVVIILTKDDCMSLLYDDGNGKVYKDMVTWLDSDDTDLQCSGILAIGNFARQEKNCIQIVQTGISKKLLDLLSQYNSIDSDLKIQHAILSTLKNLVIPQQNKSHILKEGLIDVIYPMIVIDQFLVVFKLLGTLRMVVDGQEATALDLICRKDLLEKLVYWCYNSDHLGVRVEVARILSWLIKNCHSFKPFPVFLSVKDSVKPIVEMISSNYGVMQNEAFYALQLLFIGCSDSNLTQNGNLIEKGDCTNELSKQLYDVVIDSDIGSNLSFVVNKHGDKMENATIDNLLSLLEQLLQSDAIKEHLKLSKVDESLNKLLLNSNSQITKDRINKIVTSIRN